MSRPLTQANQELLTVYEAALAAKCNQMTVRRWIDSGELKAIKLGDRMIRIRAQDFEDFMRPVKTAVQP